MDVAIIDVLIGADALIHAVVVLASPRSLAADGDEMVGVQAPYQFPLQPILIETTHL